MNKLDYAIDCFDPSSQARRAREAEKDVVEEGARLEDMCNMGGCTQLRGGCIL